MRYDVTTLRNFKTASNQLNLVENRFNHDMGIWGLPHRAAVMAWQDAPLRSAEKKHFLDL